jgi:hypothetical protein
LPTLLSTPPKRFKRPRITESDPNDAFLVAQHCVHLREVNEDDYGWVDVAGVVDIVQVPSARSFGWLRRLGGLLWLLGDAGRTECFFVVTTTSLVWVGSAMMRTAQTL